MDYTIDMIENIRENEAMEMALEIMNIKDHTVYFVNFEGYFGYSALVFKNGHHIYYINEYELHNRYLVKEKSREEATEILKQKYIENLNRKLFTEDELLAPIADYDDYELKSYYLRNYYIMQIDYVSAFSIGNKKQKELYDRIEREKLVFNPISFCYVSEENVPFCKHQAELMAELERKNDECQKSYVYMKSAFLKEMYNHEYAINWQNDYDVLSVFGNIEYKNTDDINCYFDQLEFNDTQRKAYLDARKQYYKECPEY